MSRPIRIHRFGANDIPRRSIAGYYPECNGPIPLWQYAEGSKVPAAKSVPVRISRGCRA